MPRMLDRHNAVEVSRASGVGVALLKKHSHIYIHDMCVINIFELTITKASGHDVH